MVQPPTSSGPPFSVAVRDRRHRRSRSPCRRPGVASKVTTDTVANVFSPGPPAPSVRSMAISYDGVRDRGRPLLACRGSGWAPATCGSFESELLSESGQRSAGRRSVTAGRTVGTGERRADPGTSQPAGWLPASVKQRPAHPDAQVPPCAPRAVDIITRGIMLMTQTTSASMFSDLPTSSSGPSPQPRRAPGAARGPGGLLVRPGLPVRLGDLPVDPGGREGPARSTSASM